MLSAVVEVFDKQERSGETNLGVKKIRLGPSLPAFLSPSVLELLVREFGLRPVTTVELDMDAALNRR